ncbi:dnaj homolog subfamily c member 2 isoform x1 [Nannochloropsis oceanica]
MAVVLTLPLPAASHGGGGAETSTAAGSASVLVEITSPLAWATTSPQRQIETCGLAYFQYQLKRQAIEDGEDGSGGLDHKRPRAGLEGEREEEAGDDDMGDETTFRFTKKTLTPKDVKSMDYYEMLGLGHLSAAQVGPELLKKAYRKALLLYHPDKTGRGDRDEVFIEVQKAYETLSDERKKRAYDSEMNFDDSIPTGREKGDFYKVFGPVFDRNARFAVKRPVPGLGDKDTSFDDVYRFYDYWGRFESWRDFSLKAAEENDFHSEEAGSREEKRWMQKENDKLARSMKKEEYKRLATLVDRAKAADPRLKAAKEMEKQKKEQAKLNRAAMQRQKEEARRKEDEEEAKKKEVEEAKMKVVRAQAKALRDKDKRRMRFARSRFRALCEILRIRAGLAGGKEGGKEGVVSSEEEAFMFECVDVAGMEEAVEALEGVPYVYNADESAPPPQAPTEALVEGVKQVKLIVARKRKAQQGGDDAGTKGSEAQAQAAAATATAAAAAAAAKKEVPWTEDELGVLAKAVVRFPAGTQKRWQCIAEYINHMLKLDHLRSKEECIKQYQVVQSTVGKAKVMNAVAGGGTGGGGTKAAGTTPSAVGTAVVVPGKMVGEEGGAGEGWSQEQQKQLEAGLVRFPASMEKNERWKCIAEGVEGKSKKECAERFKALKALMAKKKEVAGAAKA